MEKTIIFFLEKTSSVGRPKNLIIAFRELKEEISEISKDTNEARADYFDVVSWIEGKVENKPFKEILRKKAILTY